MLFFYMHTVFCTTGFILDNSAPSVSDQYMYSETWELGTPKGLPKTVLNSDVVLLLRFISMY